MRLLIYTHPFAPMIGGIETYTMHLARALSVGLKPGGQSLDVTVATQAAANGRDDSSLPFRVIRKPKVAQLVRLIWETDVLHIANPAFLPMLVAWLLRKPVIVEHDGYQAACPNGLLFHGLTKSDCPGYFLVRKYHECLSCNSQNVGGWGSLRMLALTFPRRWLCARMTVNVGASHHVARRVAMPRTEVIYHGVPRLAAIAKPDKSFASAGVCFAYVGRMIPEKGVAMLLRAAQVLAAQGYKFRLKLIGDGPMRPELERMTDELGLRERTAFTGFLQGKTLDEALLDATAAVMPSIWEDVSPLACIEHMMNGRLLIASDLGGLGELVDGAGLKFPAGNADALVECLRRVLEDPSLIIELGRKAHLRAQEFFALDRMVSDHKQVYFRIASSVVSHE